MDYSSSLTPPWNGLGKPELEIQNTQRLPGFFRKFLNKGREPNSFNTYYQRPSTGLMHQSEKINLASMDEARYAYLNAEKDFADVDYYQTGIRGIQHYSRELELAQHWGECQLELVPEPRNRYDSNAVKVVLKGQRIGCSSAATAKFFQGFVLGFHQAGKRVFTHGMVYKPCNGVIVLPTTSKMASLLQSESPQPLSTFWESLPIDLKQKLMDNNFHFDREAATLLSSFQSGFPLYTPYNSQSPEEAVPIVWNKFLKELRLSHRKKAARERSIRNIEIARLAASGLTYREIGEKYGLKHSTVGQIVRDLRKGNQGHASPSQSKNRKPRKINSSPMKKQIWNVG